MDTMIERVAAALGSSDVQADHRELAHRAIEAMREPTRQMIDRAFECGKVGIEEIWAVMIDAALGQPE